METCQTCRHWDAEAYYDQPEVHICRRIPQHWDAFMWDEDDNNVLKPEYVDVLAFAMDGSSYSAKLLTKAEFGCVMHQPSQVPA